MPRTRKKSRAMDLRQMLMIVIGFIFAAFGALLLITPANYVISGLSTSYNPLIGIALIVLGLVLLVYSGD